MAEMTDVERKILEDLLWKRYDKLEHNIKNWWFCCHTPTLDSKDESVFDTMSLDEYLAFESLTEQGWIEYDICPIGDHCDCGGLCRITDTGIEALGVEHDRTRNLGETASS